MELTYECSRCESNQRVDHVEAQADLTCVTCGAGRPVAAGSIVDGGLHACAYCSTGELYAQKDFPQGLGLAIVFVGFGISSVFWYYDMYMWTYGILLASALLDLALYYLVPDVIICYRCLGQHRGPGANPAGQFRFFDLAVGERYRQERLRVEEVRARNTSR
ncbi:hypothetical protein EP7_005157 [Isosphaeraceae bacterium EP7]